LRISSFKGCGIGELWNCGIEKVEILTSSGKKTGLLRMTTRSAIYYIYIKNYSKLGGKEWISRKSFLTYSF